MLRKSHFIEQDDYYELPQGTPFRQNLCLAVTPRRSNRHDQIWSSSQFNHSSMNRQRSIFQQSIRRNGNDSSKLTKNQNYVVAFDELLDQREYSFCQQRALPSFERPNKACQRSNDQEIFFASLSNIHQQMVNLDQTIIELENRMQDIKIKQLNFINGNEESLRPQRYTQQNSNELRLFNLTKEIDQDKIIELGKPDDFEKLQLVYIQQNIGGVVGKLSHLLSASASSKLALRSTELDPGSEMSFAFNKNLNKFTKIYKCKFCPLKFAKACSLGGHISRTHKEESMQCKKEALPTKKTSIVKQKKAALQKSISLALMGE